MSEKRFEKTRSDITDWRIYDYEEEDAYFIDCKDEHTVEVLVDLLNSLNDENEDYKEAVNQMEKYIKRQDRNQELYDFQIKQLKEEIAELQEDNVDTIVNLKKENEQLWKTNEKLNKEKQRLIYHMNRPPER